MRKLLIATTIATLSFGGLALAQSMGESQRDAPAANSGALRTEAPTLRPGERATPRASAAHAPAVNAERRKVAQRKVAHEEPRYSAAAQRGPEDVSADRMNHEELQKHMNDDGAQR
jgi:hypothetical protein